MYTIMMVDDDPTSLAIGRALLEGEYKLILARSGHQALGFLKQGIIPDLILLDMVMPGLGGIDVLKNLKGNPVMQDIPVIFLTGESESEQELEGYWNGAADFLEKPVIPGILRVRIVQQLSFLELKRENARLKEGLRQIKNQFDMLFPSLPNESSS